MNQTINVLKNHHSVRSFQDKEINETDLREIIQAAYLGPTSINGQQVSVIIVRDSERKKQIAKIAGGQTWIEKSPVFLTFVVDFYKTSLGVELAGKKQIIQESIESLIAGSLDVGIALGRSMTAAQSLGLGVVPIGGIRNDLSAMIELLSLPPLTFPAAGMCVGYVDIDSQLKPRMSLESFKHEEVYHKENLKNSIYQYDKEIIEHWKKIGRGDGVSWSESISSAYSKIYFPHLHSSILKQGFSTEK